MLLLYVTMGGSQPGVRDFRILLAWLELEEAGVSRQRSLDSRPGPECSVHGAVAGSCLPISRWRRGAPALCYLAVRRLPARFQPAHLGKCWCCFKGGTRMAPLPRPLSLLWSPPANGPLLETWLPAPGLGHRPGQRGPEGGSLWPSSNKPWWLAHKRPAAPSVTVLTAPTVSQEPGHRLSCPRH